MNNQAGIAIAYNPELHTKTKHIARRHFFTRELVEEQRITVPFVKTVDNCGPTSSPSPSSPSSSQPCATPS